jgi:hypothetical protein
MEHEIYSVISHKIINSHVNIRFVSRLVRYIKQQRTHLEDMWLHLPTLVVLAERNTALTGVIVCMGATCGANTVTVCCLSGGRARVIAWSFLVGSGTTCPLRLRATCTKWPAGTWGRVQQGHSEPVRPPGKQQHSMSIRPERRRRRSRLTTAGKTSNVHPRLNSTRTAACGQQENCVSTLLKGIVLLGVSFQQLFHHIYTDSFLRSIWYPHHFENWLYSLVHCPADKHCLSYGLFGHQHNKLSNKPMWYYYVPV